MKTRLLSKSASRSQSPSIVSVLWFCLLLALYVGFKCPLTLLADDPLNYSLKIPEEAVSEAVESFRQGEPRNAVQLLDSLSSPRFRGLALVAEQREQISRIAKLYLQLGDLYASQEPIEDPGRLYAQALAWQELAYPQGHPLSAIMLQRLARTQRVHGRLASASRTLQNAIQLTEKISSAAERRDGSLLFVIIWNEQGILQRSYGDYRTAAENYQKSLQALERLVEPDDVSIADARNNLAIALQFDGRYAEARRQFDKALEIFDKKKQQDKQIAAKAAMTLHSLGGLFHTQGDYLLALATYEVAIERLRKLYPQDSFPTGLPRLATATSSLGMLQSELGNARTAVKYHREALAYRRRLAGETQHADVAMSLRNLADALRISGELKEAYDLHQESLAIRRTAYASANAEASHPAIAQSLRDIGLTLEQLGDHSQSKRFLIEALVAYRQSFPETLYPDGHPDVAQVLDDLGRVFDDGGDYRQAMQYLEAAAEMRFQFAQRFMPFASEAEARNFAVRSLATPSRLLAVYQRIGIAAEQQYDTVWRTRRYIQRMLRRKQRARQLETLPANLQAQLDNYLQVRKSLAALSLSTETIGDLRSFKIQQEAIRELTLEKERLERLVASNAGSSAERSSINNLTGQDANRHPRQLLQALPSNSAWIDLVVHDDLQGDTQRQVTAFVACGDRWSRIDLGPYDAIHELALSWHESLTDRSENRELGEQLAKTVWEPLQSLLTPATTNIYLCPDGILSQLAWPALLDSSDRRLIERFCFQFVPHGHFLVEMLTRESASAKPIDDVLLVGGVDFGKLTTQSDRPNYEPSLPVAMRNASHRRWQALPETKIEIEKIERLLGSQTPHTDICRLAGTRATAVEFVDLLSAVDVAHVASHGFFVSANDLDNTLTRSGLPANDQKWVERNPLVLSGLVFANANLDPESSIILAEQIAALPLNRLRLVVLSACETGQGRLLLDEGVYGLQQAFHQAGAEQVLASRWKVDDRATQLLMVLFYENLLVRKLEVADALRGAQLTIMQRFEPREGRLRGDVRKRRPLDEALNEADMSTNVSAFYWAAFSVSGVSN